MELLFRKGEIRELPEIHALIRAAIAEMDRSGIPQWDEIYPNEAVLRSDLEAGILTIGTLEGQIAVIYTLNTSCDPEYSDGAWQHPEKSWRVIHRLCVHPDFQGRGIAKQALRQIELDTAAEGAQAIRIDVFTKNPHAQRLYRSFGYTPAGRVRFRKGLFDLMEKYI